MNTQTHLLLAAFALGKKATPRERHAILVGAVLPDLSIFVMTLTGVLQGRSGEDLWTQMYWSEPWQTLSAVSNSVFLWVAVAALGFAIGWRWLGLLGAAALLHLAFDVPFHADDAHRHLWPVSEARWHSPLSYWDRDHYGLWVSLAEAAGGLALAAALWRRHAGRWARAALALCALAYLLVPIFWLVSLGG